MKIEDIIKTTEVTGMISELKSRRGSKLPASEDYKNLDPKEHDVMDKELRKDKKIEVDPDNPESENAEPRFEKVARNPLALQKLIVKRAVAFLFGNAVRLNAEVKKDSTEAQILNAVKKILYDNKEKSLNRRVARNLFSCTEVAELWFPVPFEGKNDLYGIKSKYKLRSAIFSPLLGDTLYPYFDETGDMVAFSREFSIVTDGKPKVYFETYTDEYHYMWSDNAMVDGYPKKLDVGKIPVIYANQDQVEWADVQYLIDRLEKLLSNFSDTNDYHASPKIFVKGHVTGFAQKGESGAIIEGDENSEAEYLSWQNAPEAVKLEIETLLMMIYTITQTPDISFDSVKGLGAISGIALKLLFMDAHLKVQDHCEVFDEYLQRRINVIKAFIGRFNTNLESAADNLQIEPEIIPYMIDDEKAEIEKWVLANGNKPLISQKLSSELAGLSTDPAADYEIMQGEADRDKQFTFGEPTMA